MTFQYIESINKHEEIEVSSDYSQFVVTRHLSYFPDTLLYAAELNQYRVDNQSHYNYLFNSIRPRKRFTKWHKKEKYDNLELIMRYYELSENKALEALKVLSETDIEEIKKITNLGG